MMHVYVFHRILSIFNISFIKGAIVGSVISLCSSCILLKTFGSTWPFIRILGNISAYWLGILLLVFVSLGLVDVFTLCGRIFSGYIVKLRFLSLILAFSLILTAIVQGNRLPAISEYSIYIKDFPEEYDGLEAVVLTDLHVGFIADDRWLEKIFNIVNTLSPDMVFIVGDIIDRRAIDIDKIIPILKNLSARYGVYVVLGNHDLFTGINVEKILEDIGYHVLRNTWEEALSGVVIAGIDDPVITGQFSITTNLINRVLHGIPGGAVIFLSHSPVNVSVVASYRVGLMISGHTHGGQIWPFGYLVKMIYRYFEGIYKIGDMNLIVSRGTGTWGPAMRLWKRGEIVKVKIFSKK